jgi:hypothetical protein
MCCFSQQVEMVADTNIFARSANGRQFLVYSMTYAAATDLAMVLPLPIPANPPEDAVRFINLERYPNFFADMRRGFPEFPSTRSWSLSRGPTAGAAPKLQVHEVGRFEASFVPRIEDFDRLDERFRIPRDVWDQLPAYRDFGFAVFKLKSSRARRAAALFRRLFGGGSSANPSLTKAPWWPTRLPPRQVHPMAFDFPRRNPDLLYFPTVHIHDRKVHRAPASTICSTASPILRRANIFRAGKLLPEKHRPSWMYGACRESSFRISFATVGPSWAPWKTKTR